MGQSAFARRAARSGFVVGLAALIAGIAVDCAVARTNHAIVVGVSAYPELGEDLWLVGPRYDAEMVAAYLTTQAPIAFDDSNVTVLADGVDGAGDPTSVNIRAAFADLARVAEPGDFVYLHFSGHGTQAPALVPDSEQDGLDELFLPSDVTGWDMQTGTVPNALVDDEIGAMIGALLEGGVNVWAVFDSCHSGTVTRGATLGDEEDRERSRRLDPSALGVPAAAMHDAGRVTTRGAPTAIDETVIDLQAGDEGRFVYFYAAQTNETTPEMPLPANDPDRVPHGLFTFTVLQTLAQNPGLTYRQLGQEVLRRYSTAYRVQPTPLFEGALDLPVFATDQGEGGRVEQWPVRSERGTYSIGAGRVHGLQRDDELVLLPTAVASQDDAIASVRLTRVTDFQSEFEVADGGFVFIEPGSYVRLTGADVAFTLKAALPDPDTVPEADRAAIDDIMASLTEFQQSGLRLELVEPGARADMALDVAGGAVWLVAAGATRVPDGPNRTVSVRYADRERAETVALLADSLARIARVSNLLKVGEAFSMNDVALDITFYREAADTGERTPIAPPDVPQMKPDDAIFLEATNNTRGPLDLNILYVGSTYAIDWMYNWRINPGETLRDGVLYIASGSYGRERMLSIVTEATPQSALADFSWLTQPALPAERSTRGGTGFVGALQEAGFGTTTRAASRMQRGAGSAAIGQIAVDVVPAQ